MPGLHQGSLDRHEAAELAKEDGTGGRQEIAPRPDDSWLTNARRTDKIPDMSALSKHNAPLPPDQQAIRAKCFHPSGAFVEFEKDEIEQSIADRFEKIVRMYPDRIAMKSKSHRFTYEELNRAANRIAHTLLARCDEREETIALLLENEGPGIAAILGILKAGKIYVPLDPSLPRARMDYILGDAQATLLLTDRANHTLAQQLAKDALPIVYLDEMDANLPSENLRLTISPDTLTWILYTSGSTGKPKGVVQTHRNVLHFVRVYTNGLRICADDRLSLLFSCSANGAAHDTFSAILNGASLYPFNVKRDGPVRIAHWLNEYQITLYCSVPTVFRSFLQSIDGNESFHHVRIIKLIGEPVSRRDVELYQNYFSKRCLFVNRLGSTETGTIRWYFIDKETSIDGNIVSVGYPVEDNEILLLDDTRAELKADDIGEIAVRSRYLTPGYWQKPELTQKAFLPATGPERIYRTGDIGRMLSDGRLLFLGRKDSQVKIRGHRIEIGEIEMALLNLTMVKAAVVVAQEDLHIGDRRLLAYVVPKESSVPTVTQLRRALGETLPEHMIPSTFVFLDAFPRAPNGKVDRLALPPPDQRRPELETAFVMPRDGVEKRLTEIWQELLGIQPIGVTDNFFDLGGHSLLAVCLFSRIEKEFNTRPPLESLLNEATIEYLARVISQGSSSTPHPCLVPIQPHGSKLPFFCVHEFFGDIFCYVNLARHLGRDRPFYALQARGLNGTGEAFDNIEAMATYYIDEIRTVQPEGPYALGGLCFGGTVAFEMARQLRAKAEKVALVALFDSAINSGYSKADWWRSFLHDLPRDIPSWLTGFLQLNRAQWRSLVKLKVRMAKASLRNALRSSDDGSQENNAPTFIQEMGDLFEFSEQHRKVARAQYWALRQYKPKIYPGRLTLFRARMQPLFSSHNPDKGWSRLAGGGLDITVVPGNHLGMLQEPHVRILAQQLRTCLDKALTEVNAA
jgi:amino acid adenylation domain-containing protein